MIGRIKAGTSAFARAIMRPQDLRGGVRAAGFVDARAYNPNGVLFWEDLNLHNIVVNQGLDHVLDTQLSGGTPVTTWYVELIDGGPPTLVAGDTYQSHAGWTEVTNYTGERQTWVDGGVSAQSVSNSGSPASFAILGAVTVGGVALVSFATKSDVSTGKFMYSEVAFSSDRGLDTGDTLEITYTQTMIDDA